MAEKRLKGMFRFSASFSAIKLEVEVGTIWLLISSLESHLLPFVWAYFQPFWSTSGFDHFFGDETGS